MIANWRVDLTCVDAPEVHYSRDVGMRRYYDAVSLVQEAAARDQPQREWQFQSVTRIVRPILNPLED